MPSSSMPQPRIDPFMHTGDGVDRGYIVRLARSWIGTPYHHQASKRGVGTDCIGLVRGIWRALYGAEAETAPAYSRDWAEATGEETLLEAARRHLIEVDTGRGPARRRPRLPLPRDDRRQARRHPGHARHHDPRLRRRPRLRGHALALVAPPPRRRLRLSRCGVSPAGLTP